MSETNNYPNFYEPTEGRPPLGVEQLTETTQTFNGLFDELMLHGMDKVKQFEAIKGRPTANLLRLIEVDGQTYSLTLKDKSPRDLASERHGITFRDSESFTREISLQRIAEGYGREGWSYRLGTDGKVRRWDDGDVIAKMRKNQELGIEGPIMLDGNEKNEDIRQFALASIQSIITDVIPNSRLAEDMGLNNQPVTTEEIKGLQDFLARAPDTPS